MERSSEIYNLACNACYFLVFQFLFVFLFYFESNFSQYPARFFYAFLATIALGMELFMILYDLESVSLRKTLPGLKEVGCLLFSFGFYLRLLDRSYFWPVVAAFSLPAIGFLGSKKAPAQPNQ